jgi:signal transduction histidine kinase
MTDANDNKLSILYVEDEQDAREMLSEVISFRYPDMKLLIAENGKTGVELFKRHMPEIVITDINMPVMNGIKMSSEIRELSPSSEIIALTAHTDTQYLLQAIQIGINHYILKPIEVKQIYETIDKSVAIVQAKLEIARQNRLISQLNEELTRKTEDLELANKELESYDYTVAHDLRSPMVVIGGAFQKLIDKYADSMDSDGKGCLLTIHQEFIRMTSLVEALLGFSIRARKHPDKKRTNLSVIVHEISRNLQDREPRRKVKFMIQDGIDGYCDPALIRIIFENLLENAWKYSADKDEVLIEFGAINEETDLVYYVRDNGSGFDDSEAVKIFTPFQRLENDENVEGFGIGMATSFRIINRHGGRIWAEAEKGKGATFYFTL